MSAHCDHHPPQTEKIVNLPRYRQILWIALVVNFTMFLVEIGAGVQAGSLSLLADAVDFAGDALNYAVSLAVLASALAWRARAAVFKAATMIGFGLYVLGSAVWSVWNGELPQAVTMVFTSSAHIQKHRHHRCHFRSRPEADRSQRADALSG